MKVAPHGNVVKRVSESLLSEAEAQTPQKVTTTPTKPDPFEFIIDQILPAREVHIIAGPSGSGKTTWLLPTIVAWKRGQKVLGYNSFPKPFVYVACDRSEADMLRTFRRLGIDPKEIPHFSALSDGLSNFDAIVTRARQMVSDVRVLFIEALPALLGAGSIIDYGIVSNFVRKATALCVEKNFTIVCTGHAPKEKEGQGYKSPRQKVIGSSAWGGFGNTLIIFEPQGRTGKLVKVSVLPRNAPDQVLFFERGENGRLEPTSAQKLEQFSHDLLNDFLDKLAPGDEFGTSELIEKFAVSKSGFYRWLNQAEQENRIERVKQGTYRRLPDMPVKPLPPTVGKVGKSPVCV